MSALGRLDLLASDPATHAPTRIPGLVRFSLDIRSEDLERAGVRVGVAK